MSQFINEEDDLIAKNLQKKIIDEKYDLITRNLHSKIMDENIAKKILATRPLKIYWGTSPTQIPHLGYFAPIFKIIDFLQAGCEVIIFIADLHAVLDNMKSNFEQVALRTKVYTIIIQELMKSLNVDIGKLKFVVGSDFQLSKEYTLDMYKAHSLISVAEAKHAGAEVVKQNDNPKLTGLMYPTLQALDEQYLDVDAQLGGVDQRKIFVHARTIMPALGYKKRFHLMNKMVPGLRGEKKQLAKIEDADNDLKDKLKLLLECDDDKLFDQLKELVESNGKKEVEFDKMSASNINSKISLLDTKNQIKSKINKAYCLPGDIEDNCLLEMLEHIVFPILKLKGDIFTVNRKEQYGGKLTYDNIDDVKNDFKDEKLHPGDFKIGVFECLNNLIEPIRKVFDEPENKNLLKKAY